MQGAFIESLESRTLYSGSIAAEFIGTLPQTLLPVSPDHVTVQISNTGDARAAGTVGVSLYLSPQPGIGAQSVLIGGAAKRLNVKPGRSTNLNVKFKLPASLADGQYFLAAGLSATGVQPATAVVSDASLVAVQAPTDSLIGSFASSPLTVGLDTAGDGGTGAVKLRVTNPTAMAVHGSISANLYLSTATQLNATTQWVGTLTDRHANIPAGRSITIPGNVTIPATTPFGTYHLLAVLKNTPAGGSGTAVFARQPITITQGEDNSDNGDDGGIIDTGDDGDDGDDDGDTTDQGNTGDEGDNGGDTNPAPPTTEDNGGGDTTQPTTGPTDDSGGDSGDSGGDDPGGGDSGGDDGGGDDGDDTLRAAAATKPATIARV
jgi:hypothetical protein